MVLRLNLLPTLLLAGLAPAAIAQPATGSTSPAESAPAQITLTMNEAIVRALDSNLEVSIERLRPEIAEQRRQFALGVFDPRIDMAATWESLERPQNTRDFFATGRAVEIFEEENIRFEGVLGGTLPTSTRYRVTVRANELKNSLNREALSRFYPEYTSSTSFTLTQPLLRGFGIGAAMAEARVAASELKGTEQALRGRIDQIATNVLDAYIEAQYARELVRVITERISIAERLRSENDKRHKQGLMAPIDVLQAESTVAAAEIEKVRAQSFLVETENRLRELMFADFLEVADTKLVLVDELRPVQVDDSLIALRNLALERSAEYKLAEQRVETEKLRVRYARNQLLPRFDLEASIGYNGLGGEVGSSFLDYEDRTQPDYSVGFVASIPITFKQERARLRETLLRLREAELEMKRAANRISAQVHTAYSRVTAAQQRADSAARAAAAAAATLDAEEKRLAQGLTTSFNVLRLQDQHSQARINQLEAVAEGRKAQAILWGVVGVLLERHQIEAIDKTVKGKRS